MMWTCMQGDVVVFVFIVNVSSPEGWNGNGWHGLLRGQHTLHMWNQFHFLWFIWTFLWTIDLTKNERKFEIGKIVIFINGIFLSGFQCWKIAQRTVGQYVFHSDGCVTRCSRGKEIKWAYAETIWINWNIFTWRKFLFRLSGPIGDKQTIFHYVAYNLLFIFGFSIHKLSFLSEGFTIGPQNKISICGIVHTLVVIWNSSGRSSLFNKNLPSSLDSSHHCHIHWALLENSNKENRIRAHLK